MFGTFSIARPEDATRRWLCLVVCDICKRASAFDERRVKNPIVKAEEIARAHVCAHRDLTEAEKAELRKPKPLPAYRPRLIQVKGGTLRQRVFGSANDEGGKESDSRNSGKR